MSDPVEAVPEAIARHLSGPIPSRSTMATPLPEPLRSTLSSLPDPAVVVDQDLRVLWCNEAYIRLSGLRPREFEARRTAGLRCTDLLEMSICGNSCAVRACERKRCQVNVHEVEGHAGLAKAEETTFLVTAFPTAVAGSAAASVEIYRDVTAERRVQQRFQKLLESERRHSEDLEEQVKKRTAELEQSLRDLERAKDQLVQSEKLSSLGQLVAGIAHELNNPINFIYGNTGFLKDYITGLLGLVDMARGFKSLTADEIGTFDAAARSADLEFIRSDALKLVASIRTGAERTAQIVRGLRIFARAGQLEMEDTDLRECLDATAVVLSPLFKGDVKLVTRVESLGRVRCNSSQINQVLMNLIRNARDAIEGKGTVNVEITRDGDDAVIRVADDGRGIPAENLGRIFDPFFTTKPVGQGQGLGLSISYSIVQSHGGTIAVESKPRQGTTFTVRLPMAGRPVAAAKEGAAPSATAAAAAPGR